jgi:hypothetical protein
VVAQQALGAMPPTQSGATYPGTQSFDGKWSGTAFYPEETLPYFDFFFKGPTSEHTGYMPNEKLFTTLQSNSPELKVLDVQGRNLDAETMGAVTNALLGNTQVVEAKLGRNVSFWNEQPDDFGQALAAVLKENTSITKLDAKNNDIEEDEMEAIMKALETNTTLTWLDLSDNFGRSKGKEIGGMLKANKTLKYLNLNVNQLHDEDCEAVLAGLEANTTLQEFSGYNNGAISKETRKKMRGFKR